MEEGATISLTDYLGKNRPFIIPNYQRGYIWGKSKDRKLNSVEYLMNSIIDSYEKETELFLQGITVSENDKSIEIIDGQQRTTALYLLLCYLKYDSGFRIKYNVRTESDAFLLNIKNLSTLDLNNVCIEKSKEEYQDIYFFKKTIRIYNDKLINYSNDKLTTLRSHILTKIKFLYINIPANQSTTVFTMMNGNKAEMYPEEIIKAEMIRLISLDDSVIKSFEKEAREWDKNLLRSKYAREWDKWVYWWNREDVQNYYMCYNVMGLLVSTYFKSKRTNKNQEFNYDNFRDCCLRGSNGESNIITAKHTFDGLRRLQKRFEDAFNNYTTYNQIGAILRLGNKDAFIDYYFIDQNCENLTDYFKYVFLPDLTHVIIKSKLHENTSVLQLNGQIDKSISEALYRLSDNDLYNKYYETGYNFLLRQNIEQDIKLKRKFDFSINKERSLEHIFPKSKVYYIEDDIKYKQNRKKDEKELFTETANIVDRKDIEKLGCTEHCIGNLVLIYDNENSSFGTKDFDGKKSLYFDYDKKELFKSRHLLHSIAIFSNSSWGVEQIKNNKEKAIINFKKYYGISE